MRISAVLLCLMSGIFFVAITVPLLNENDTYDIFQAYNLSLPKNPKSSERSDMTARHGHVASYHLEAGDS